jgi:glycerol-3-phosphate dehydrogenase (NAD(P)+)
MKVTFLGAGSWGTALAIMLAKNGHEVKLWSAVQSEIDMLQTYREHKNRLPGVKLPDSIEVTGDLEFALKGDKGPDFVVFAVASPFVRATAKKAAVLISEGQIVVNVAKGLEDSTLKSLCTCIKEEIPQAKTAVLSGPSHAEEVSIGMPTTVVSASDDQETAEKVQDLFMNERFRVYSSPDMVGVELGGAIKNVIALAAGIIDGLGYQDNTKASLMTRGINEISCLGVKMGGKMETFFGLSGIGDLIVTCTSTHSRNHNAGFLIGQGKSLEEALEEIGQVVEGVNTAKAAEALADKYNVSMPIVTAINDVLFRGKEVKQAVFDLYTRDKKEEYPTLTW